MDKRLDMAIYHLSVKPVSRGAGRSATAAAAYRSATRVDDHTSGQAFNYTRKRGVEHAEIVLAAKAAQQDIHWARDRQQLWNAAETAEKRKDARVAREYELALPHELTKAERIKLTRTFASELANRYGVAVDVALHRPHRDGDTRNFHAHVLTTTREVTPTGLGKKATIELGDGDRARVGLPPAKTEIVALRERWAELVNAHLAERGVEARIDHRSLEAQGIDRAPTVHKGVAESALERRGVATEVAKRVAWQAQEAAQQRLAVAAELGRVAQERTQLERSVIELSDDIAAARRARNATQHMTPEQARAQARATWLEQRQPAQTEATHDQTSGIVLTLTRDRGGSRGGRDDDRGR
jgi:ATP-dependent exoDNAse (exonuclease V) alpha subunit